MSFSKYVVPSQYDVVVTGKPVVVLTAVDELLIAVVAAQVADPEPSLFGATKCLP